MTTETCNKVGRPEVEIDWKKVDFLIEAGCSGYEIASMIGIHHDTFYNRISAQYGESFTDYSAKRRPKGDASIRVKQYQKALQGDNSMLIWLGKNRLKQKDKEEAEIGDVIIKTIQYVDAKRNNPAVQVPTEELSTSCSESPG